MNDTAESKTRGIYPEKENGVTYLRALCILGIVADNFSVAR